MSYIKLNGVLKEIVELYSNIELCGFLAGRLQVPPDKAEELAERIEKQLWLTQNKPRSIFPMTVLDDSPVAKQPVKSTTYPVSSLLGKEFGVFIKWLLEELGYKIQKTLAEKKGCEIVAIKDGEKIAIQARKSSQNNLLSDLIVLVSQQAKRNYDCNHSIIIATTHFSERAIAMAEEFGVELWDSCVLDEKIAQVHRQSQVREPYCFPKFKGSLLESLLGLADTKDFIVESRADGKYDLFLPGVRYPLLTFQADSGRVIGCVCRIKFNEPVGEGEGTVLFSDRDENRLDDAVAYDSVIQYLEDFVK